MFEVEEGCRGMWKRRLVRTGVVLAVLFVAFVFGWAPYFLAGIGTTRRFVYKDALNDGLTPKSFGLAFDDVSFRSSDGVSLSGWWVPAVGAGEGGANGSVVMIHGLNRSRVEMVRRIPFVHSQGWNALAFDLRHHGASGGVATTFGAKEQEDVAAAARLARQRSPGPVVLWGVSLGAASAMLAAAEDPAVAGVICDSSYRSLDDTARHHLQLFRSFRPWLRLVPVWPVADEALFWMGRRGGFDPASVDVQRAAGRLAGRPLLFVAVSEDRRMPRQIAFDLQQAVGSSAELLVVPGRSHGGAWRDGTAAYEAAVRELLEKARRSAGRVAGEERERGPL